MQSIFCFFFQQVLPDLKNGSGVPNSFITSVRPCDFKNLCKNITVNVFQLYAPNRLSMILPAVILVAFTNTLSAGDEISFRNICREIGKKSKVEGILNGIILQVMYILLYHLSYRHPSWALRPRESKVI